MAKPKPHDPKHDALRQRGALHARADEVADPLFAGSDFFDSRDVVQVKYEMLRRVRIDGQPVAGTVRAFGFSRPSFYEAQGALAREGLAGLVPRKRGPRQPHKLTAEVVAFLRDELSADGSLTTTALARRLRDRFELSVHPRSIERALARSEKKTP